MVFCHNYYGVKLPLIMLQKRFFHHYYGVKLPFIMLQKLLSITITMEWNYPLSCYRNGSPYLQNRLTFTIGEVYRCICVQVYRFSTIWVFFYYISQLFYKCIDNWHRFIFSGWLYPNSIVCIGTSSTVVFLALLAIFFIQCFLPSSSSPIVMFFYSFTLDCIMCLLADMFGTIW